MERLGVGKVILGADRVAGDGSVANKVGSADIARVAKDFAVPFYYATSYSTMSLAIKRGSDIPIEERSPREITDPYRAVALELKASGRLSPAALEEWPPASVLTARWPGRGEVRLFNPAFDVTPPSLITGIITDIGLFKPSEITSLAEERVEEMAAARVQSLLGVSPK